LVLQRIIEDFRILSLVDIHEYTIKPQLMRPSELGAHVMQLMSGNMHKHSFHTAMWVDDYLININVDVERMMQVFKNIIDNAIKYAPAYSTITLTGDAQSDRVIITCSDQGIGIDPSHLPYIFERFYRSPNNPSPGSGIGLAIAKTIIEAHGGQISATSTLGQGTTITILLPVYPNTRIPTTD
jgi:signal transduction histidine kinase